MKFIEYIKKGNLPILLKIALFLSSLDILISCSDIWNVPKIIQYGIWAIEIILYLYISLPSLIKGNLFEKKKIIYYILIILSTITTVRMHNRSLLFLFLTCYAIKDYKLEDIFKVLIKSISLILILEFLTWLLVLIISKKNIGTYGIRNGRVRNGFGIGHPNTLSILISNLVVMKMYIEFNNKKPLKYVLYFLTSIGCYYLTGSKTAFITMIVVFLTLVFIERIDRYNSKLLFVSKMMFPIMFLVYFLLVYLYAKGYYLGILADKALTGRLMLTSMIMEKEKITLFGQLVNYSLVNNGGYFYLDSMFPYFVYELGIVWFVIISTLIYKSALNNPRNILLILFLCLVSLGEHVGINYIFVCSCLMFNDLFKNQKY